MSILIYLSNQDVKAIEGTVKRGQVTVTRSYCAQAPQGSIINGLVVNEEVFTEFLVNFWERNQLPKQGVILVLGSAQAVTRLIEAPKLSGKKMMEYLPREFASVERTKEPVYSYLTLSVEGTMCKILATMVDRSFLKPHVDRFHAMGVRLEGIVMATMAEIQAFHHFSYLRDKTCLIQMLDGMSLLNVLYVNGEYHQLIRSRVFQERGTAGFAMECARAINNQQQFLENQPIEAEITHIYLGGEFGDEDVRLCHESIIEMDAGLKVERIHEEADGILRFPNQGEFEHFENFIPAIGGLLVPKGHRNLLYQYGQGTERLKRRREIIKYLFPSVAALLVLGTVAAVQGLIWHSRMAIVSEQLDHMGNPEVITTVVEYDRLMMENDALGRRADIIKQTKENLDSYPLYTSYVRQVAQECAADIVTVEVTGYEAALGCVSFAVSSDHAEGIHQFVERMENRTDVFEDIIYDGFRYDETSSIWKASAEGVLIQPVLADGQVES